jgi:hypothetical protein
MDALPYAVALVCLAGVAIVALRLVYAALLRRRSQSWPCAPTTIEDGAIGPPGRNLMCELEVDYTYTVDGQTYSGTYKQECQSESDAQDVLKSLRELPPPARYKPGNPSVSVMDPYRDAAPAAGSQR